VTGRDREPMDDDQESNRPSHFTQEVAGSSRFFARPFGSEMGARENALKRLFFPSG